MNQDEIDHGRELFRKYDVDHSDSIDDEELEAILTDMGHHLSYEETLRLTSQVCERPGNMSFLELLDFLALLKHNAATLEDEADLKASFEYLGGEEGGGGGIDKQKLDDLLEEFHLPMHSEDLLKKLDKNNNNEIEYNELQSLL